MSADMTAPVFEAHGLTVSRAGDAGPVDVLDHVGLTLHAGTLTDVVGPSGSGKTTLLLALARLLPGVEGVLALEGRPATEIDPREWRSIVAYLPQRPSLMPGTVGDNLLLPWRLKVRAGRDAPPSPSLRTALDGVRLGDVGLERDVTRLSEGQAARVALLRTILTRPRVLLLDEPDAALDEGSAAEVSRLTREFVDGDGAVVRVRHHGSDGTATRRLTMAGGSLTEERS